MLDATGHPLVTQHAGYQVLSEVAFSPDGTLIVTGEDDGVIRLWAAPAVTAGM